MEMKWTFDWAITDRVKWPSLFGRITVLTDESLGDGIEAYCEAFNYAFDAVATSTKAEMVINLDLCI